MAAPMPGKLSLLGSTGSIGRQTLEVMAFHGLRPAVLTGHRNGVLLEEQARRFTPELVCVADEAAGRDVRQRLSDTSVKVMTGPESLLYAASHQSADTVLNALVGLAGLAPTMAALGAGKRLLLANKESLVYGGALVTAAAPGGIIPVDSEHSAIFQCLRGGRQGVRRLILTASGGAFRGWPRERLDMVTPDMALRHPNWSMGPKVTVDSATLLNKGLECIEAMHLFGVSADSISVVIHPQSIVHSLVEYDDGAMVAQLGAPDMRLPIQYALFYPERKPCPGPPLDLLRAGTLTFEEPDREAFPCLELALSAARRGGNAGAVLCGAGEAAVEDFLRGGCSFLGIPERIERALSAVPFLPHPTLEELFETDRLARQV